MVDAFRASTTIAVLVSAGVRVLTVASPEAARAATADYRAAERGSKKLPGFDLGNSPTEAATAELRPGSILALTTTNGTRIIEAARGAAEILIGAFVNAEAVADSVAGPLEEPSGLEVAVIGCGWRGKRASEDERAAGAILHRLSGRGATLDVRAERVVDAYRNRPRRELYRNAAARRLKTLGYGHDLDFCLTEDSVTVVPRLTDGLFLPFGAFEGTGR